MIPESDTTIDTTLGPLVMLVRVDRHGKHHRQAMPAALAVLFAGHDVLNGVHWVRAWIVADDVDMGAWDRSA